MAYPVNQHWRALGRALEAARFDFKKDLIWVKDVASFFAQTTYNQQHETILVLQRRGKALGANTPSNASTVLEFPRPRAHKLHPTQKPLELWETLLAWHTKKGDKVVDPFLGSGTTLIAAERLGRVCSGIEISPVFCDTIIARWEELTGEKAKRL